MPIPTCNSLILIDLVFALAGRKSIGAHNLQACAKPTVKKRQDGLKYKTEKRRKKKGLISPLRKSQHNLENTFTHYKATHN
jgi:hypothetical protein